MNIENANKVEQLLKEKHSVERSIDELFLLKSDDVIKSVEILIFSPSERSCIGTNGMQV